MRYWISIAVISWCLAVSARALTPPETNRVYSFKGPLGGGYVVEASQLRAAAKAEGPAWVKARPVNAPRREIELGSRLVLRLAPGLDLTAFLARSPLRLSVKAGPDLYVLEAPGIEPALAEAERLAGLPGVLEARPVVRRLMRKTGPYLARPNDTFFSRQWHLENREASGVRQGPDLNVRAAWPFSRGEGVVIAVVDDGVELTHPELAARTAGVPHYNFEFSSTNGGPPGADAMHATAVAGFAAAELNNRRGVSGVAPAAKISSLVIFTLDGWTVDETELAKAFQFQSNIIHIQNHSWVSSAGYLSGPTSIEEVGLSNAIAFGRGGRGTIMVRAAGNGRDDEENANEDGYISDPRAIGVAAVRTDGRVASYSAPGACLLVAGLAGDDGFDASLTTDRVGSAGYNTFTFPDDYADYDDGFIGTSATAPQVAGLAALALSVNSNLTYRDVQQVLLLSARQTDPADPHLQTNGAGLRVGPNAGFGVPDAAHLVHLARHWSNRPPLQVARFTNSTLTSIPEQGMRVVLAGNDLPPDLLFIPAQAADLGPRADKPTASLPLSHLGPALAPPATNLAGRAALIQRGVNFFTNKIINAAQAGAAFAIIHNNVSESALVVMSITDDLPIPAVFISQANGLALSNLIQTNSSVTARLQLNAAAYSFSVPDTLLCEHVGVRVRTDHPRRGHLRITVQSPAGTVSVLQRTGYDTWPGPEDWTYYSTHHFYESSHGTWTVQISDEYAGYTGNALGVELILYGTPIADANRDGLDDAWELQWLQAALAAPAADPDGDGYPNVVEYILGTDPRAPNRALSLDLSFIDPALARLSWPSATNRHYSIYGGADLAQPLTLLTNLPGQFPETEWPAGVQGGRRFFRVIGQPAP